MKTASLYSSQLSVTANEQSFSSINITDNIMKKLANVSPFLLLLVPVFVMMLLTLTTVNLNSQNEEMAVKNSTSKSILKVSTVSFK